MTHPRAQFIGIWITVALLLLSFVGTPHAADIPLYHTPTIVGIAVLLWLTSRNPVTDLSMACILFYLFLHILGSRYFYTDVPYDQWCKALTGTTISDCFGWQRNHYDRLVHFMYGVLAMAPQMELLRRVLNMSALVAALLSVSLVVCVGGLYEIFEWLLTLFAAPDQADRYNGQQGDMWDAQKDMALAFVGACLSGAALLAAGLPRVRSLASQPSRASR